MFGMPDDIKAIGCSRLIEDLIEMVDIFFGQVASEAPREPL